MFTVMFQWRFTGMDCTVEEMRENKNLLVDQDKFCTDFLLRI
jgi:hypothetical protein